MLAYMNRKKLGLLLQLPYRMARKRTQTKYENSKISNRPKLRISCAQSLNSALHEIVESYQGQWIIVEEFIIQCLLGTQTFVRVTYH